jgi:type IV pilus assembly protein PilC
MMPKYSYKVRDREDRVVLGTMEAASADEVLDRLSDKDLLPVLVKEIGLDSAPPSKTLKERVNESINNSRNRVPYKSVVFFTRQLATMVGQGVPLSKALNQLTKGEKPVFQRIIQQVDEDISTGLTFSDAIARHPGAFSPMYVALSHSGEVSGALDQVLEGLANYMENVEIMRGKVKTAMRYPIFIAGFVTVMMIGIMWKLVPTFENIYSSLGANLPLPTRILIQASHLFQDHFFILIGLSLAAFGLFKFFMTQERFQVVYQKNVLRMPVFGTILQKNIWATYCRTMALLLEAGTPILKATEIAGATVNNRYFAKSLDQVYGALRKGELLSNALETSGLFPVLVVQLVSTGETSGRVDSLLRKAAEFYEREIRNVVDSLASIIEPILIVILGAIVGAVLFSLYLPVFKVGELVR